MRDFNASNAENTARLGAAIVRASNGVASDTKPGFQLCYRSPIGGSGRLAVYGCADEAERAAEFQRNGHYSGAGANPVQHWIEEVRIPSDYVFAIYK